MKFLHKLFGLPEFEDEQDSLTADWLLITLLSLVLIFLLIVLNTLLLPENFPFYIWTVVLSIITIVPSYLLLRQGQARLASIVFIAFVLLTVTYTNFVNGGEIRPAIVIYNVFVLIAGLLLGGWGAITTAVVLALQSVVIILARENGVVTTATTPPTAGASMVILSIGYLLNGIMFSLAANAINNLLGKLRKELAQRQQVEQQLRESLQEKETLLKEIHHRVKNNLQVVVSILNLQIGYVTDTTTREILHSGQNRVRSMALVHEKLYRSSDLARIDFREYLQHLASTLFNSYNLDTNQVCLTFDIGEVALGVDTAVPCGLIANELIANALKHAFPNNQAGEIVITLQPTGKGSLELSVQDNGVGIPDGKDWRQTESLGMQLVQSLVKQIGGTIELKRLSPGTQFVILFSI